MLCKAKTLKLYTLNGSDGNVGTVKDLYFDDTFWTVRYLVAETGDWLTDRQVLISPYALGHINRDERHIVVTLTRKQIEDSPSLDTHKPVSRQFEEDYFGYYGWPLYLGGPYNWGHHPHIERNQRNWRHSAPGEYAWDAHLRSTEDVSGHVIHALDGDLGHVEDFVIDDDTWAIRYLVIHTANWWPGRKVLIAPKWIKSISWGQSKVFVNLQREAIQHAPEYSEDFLMTREYEIALHKHYHHPGYWDDESI
jgi:hypothetical protein